ncbi:uncharacterized protein LOC124530923 [Vanessa cardui]|uniref:uncharacterized protein LOC124530923 n=1 Tax=Vanessa cardui TaxID=171605 RepID=UPI001F143D24|nr:uncharacterized protein LOC124530923 [Vanessa cardui]
MDNPTPKTNISIGRRIINVSYFLEKLYEISNHGPLDCGLTCIEKVSEKLHGLSSIFTFLCKMCNRKFVIGNDDDNCLPINTCVVAGIISIGCGHSQLQELSSAMNLPMMSQKTYQTNHKLLSQNWQQLAQQSMEQAAEEEKKMAIVDGRVTKNGTPVIDVVADGVYGKRSYKKNYSALSGAAAIIGRKTGKILYLGVRNKYCYHCDRAEKKKIAVAEHFCSKNYSGPSTGMESEIIVEGFKQSLAIHGLIYGRLISDGDSSTYSKILQARPYKDITVEKVECRNHLLRNFCNKMQALQTETKYLKSHRKLLTTSRIMSIRSCIRKAIKKNKNDPFPEEQYLFDDILQAHHHAFGNHHECKSYFCDEIGNLEKNDIPKDFELGSLWQRICIMIQSIAGQARSLLHDVYSNVVERYHSIIAKYVGGKRVNYSLKNSYQTRCVASAVSYNEENALSKLYKKMTNKSPGGKLKMWEESKYKQKILSMRYTKKKRRLVFNKKQSDKDYGQSCQKPDMPVDLLDKMKNDFIKSLDKTDEERAMIERKTILQSANGEWLEMRRSLLTASNFGRVIKRRVNTPCANLVKDILYRKNIDHVESIAHGQQNEKKRSL